MIEDPSVNGPDYLPGRKWADDGDDTETEKCDGCECDFDPEDLTLHEDGNRYCEGCNYTTKQDDIDAEGDRLYHEMRDDQ